MDTNICEVSDSQNLVMQQGIYMYLKVIAITKSKQTKEQ